MSSSKDKFDQLIDLYKFWFGLFVQSTLASFTIAGALLSWVLNDHSESAMALLLPAAISGSLGFAFCTSAWMKQLRLEKYVCDLCASSDEVDIDYAPSFRLFGWALLIFGVFQFCVAGACIQVFMDKYICKST